MHNMKAHICDKLIWPQAQHIYYSDGLYVVFFPPHEMQLIIFAQKWVEGGRCFKDKSPKTFA